MKGLQSGILLISCVVWWSATALAVPAHRSLTFTDGTTGPVTFEGRTHRMGCTECHQTGIFPIMRQGSETITMEKIEAGKQCGACHNGQRAFAVTGNCTRCHKPPAAPRE